MITVSNVNGNDNGNDSGNDNGNQIHYSSATCYLESLSR